MTKAEAKRMAHRIAADQIREWLDRDYADTGSELSDDDIRRLDTALADLMEAHYAKGGE